MLRVLFAAAAAIAILNSAAVAADPGWSGFYVGANAGYGWSNAAISEVPGDQNTATFFLGQPNVASSSTSFRGGGWLGGVQAGYNWLPGQNWLAGVEADINGSNIAGNGSTPTTVVFGQNTATLQTNQNIQWFGTVRARVGYLVTADIMFFATGGLAYGKVSENASIVLPPGASNSQGNFGSGYACGGFYGDSTCFAGSTSRVSTGWTAGAGTEFRINQHASVKLEYLYVNLGTGSFPLLAAHPGAMNPSVLNASGDASFNLVRAGLNFRF
ncbi:MAG: porin family protein [Bradyrhizobium sp.]|nr:porin family protein [Bradyrhizobium sp.]